MTKTLLITLFIALFMQSTSFSQSLYEDSGDYNNNIHIGITPIPFYGFASLNYERKIIQLNKSRISAEAGFGYWSNWNNIGSSYKLKVNNTFGKKKHHLETGMGLMALYDNTSYKIAVSNANNSELIPTKQDYVDYNVAASIGYLYKKPQGNFIFKVGFAWPESLYLAFGYAF